MDGKLLARIGGAVFVGLAIAVTVMRLAAEPEPRVEPTLSAWERDGDPLPARLKACSQMGELARSLPSCRAAWAEKRRRFFGARHPHALREPGEQPVRSDPDFGPSSMRGED